jgi:hypothetical protein
LRLSLEADVDCVTSLCFEDTKANEKLLVGAATSEVFSPNVKLFEAVNREVEVEAEAGPEEAAAPVPAGAVEDSVDVLSTFVDVPPNEKGVSKFGIEMEKFEEGIADSDVFVFSVTCSCVGLVFPSAADRVDGAGAGAESLIVVEFS